MTVRRYCDNCKDQIDVGAMFYGIHIQKLREEEELKVTIHGNKSVDICRDCMMTDQYYDLSFETEEFYEDGEKKDKK